MHDSYLDTVESKCTSCLPPLKDQLQLSQLHKDFFQDWFFSFFFFFFPIYFKEVLLQPVIREYKKRVSSHTSNFWVGKSLLLHGAKWW